MFHLIRLAIWLIGLAFVTTFVLSLFRYEMNWNALKENNATCSAQWQKCWSDGKINPDQTCSVRCWFEEPLFRKTDTP